MESAREEHLSKVYFIRSILSKISENSDSICQKEEALKGETERIFTIKRPELPADLQEKENIEYSKDFPQYLKKHADEDVVINYQNNIVQLLAINKFAEEQENKLKEICNTRNDKKDIIYGISRRIITMIILGILFATALVCSVLARANFYLILFLLAAILFCCFVTIVKQREKSKLLKEIKLLDCEAKTISEKLSEFYDSNARAEYVKIKNQNDEIKKIILREVRNEYDKSIRERNRKQYENFEKSVVSWQSQKNDFENDKRQNIEKLESEINDIKTKSIDLYNILKCDFKMFLDERDWDNVDLIIYELETGRADTIKEALQQADVYIRHNEIKQVMTTATEAICTTIRESIVSLSGSINTTLMGLRSDLLEININNREMSKKFDEIVNAQELSNALLKKASVSSEQLAADVGRLRFIRDVEYYRT